MFLLYRFLLGNGSKIATRSSKTAEPARNSGHGWYFASGVEFASMAVSDTSLQELARRLSENDFGQDHNEQMLTDFVRFYQHTS